MKIKITELVGSIEAILIALRRERVHTRRYESDAAENLRRFVTAYHDGSLSLVDDDISIIRNTDALSAALARAQAACSYLDEEIQTTRSLIKGTESVQPEPTTESNAPQQDGNAAVQELQALLRVLHHNTRERVQGLLRELERARESTRGSRPNFTCDYCGSEFETADEKYSHTFEECDRAQKVAFAASCDHQFVDARNQGVESGEVCIRCGALQVGRNDND